MINAAIKEILESVPGVGVVSDYIRWAENWNTIIDRISSGGIVNTWMISRIATESRRRNRKELMHTFQIIGMYELNDENESEKTFQSLIDSVMTELDEYQTLNGTVETIHADWGKLAGFDGLQIDNIEVRKIGGRLVHYASCRLPVLEIIE